MANGKVFIIGSVFSVLGAVLLLYMMHDTSWMVRDSSEGSTIERFEFGLYSSTLQYSEDNQTVMAYGDDNEWVSKNCDASSNTNSTDDDKMCEVISAGETGHWILISGIALAVIALILAGIGISGYVPGWIPMLLNVLATLVIIVGSVIWLVQFPDLNENADVDDPRLSPSYGFYVSLVSTALFFLGGLAWGGVEAFNIETDDDLGEEDEWHDAMATADPSSADWRDQNVPTSVQGTEAPHQYQQEQMLQQYEFQDQGYHHQQSYAEPRQDWQRSAPRSAPGPSAAPSSGPPGSTATPHSGPPGSTASPSSGPPGSTASPSSGPPGSTASPSSGPPGPQSAQLQGPPGSTYGQPQQPKVRKASQPVQQPAAPVQQPVPAAAPVTPAQPTQYAQPVPATPQQQPVPPAAPVQHPAVPVQQPVPAAAPVQQIPSTQQLQQYIAPHQMSTTAQSTPPPEAKGQIRPDGWEILEWPQGSSRWYWKNQNTGQWSRWT